MSDSRHSTVFTHVNAEDDIEYGSQPRIRGEPFLRIRNQPDYISLGPEGTTNTKFMCLALREPEQAPTFNTRCTYPCSEPAVYSKLREDLCRTTPVPLIRCRWEKLSAAGTKYIARVRDTWMTLKVAIPEKAPTTLEGSTIVWLLSLSFHTVAQEDEIIYFELDDAQVYTELYLETKSTGVRERGGSQIKSRCRLARSNGSLASQHAVDVQSAEKQTIERQRQFSKTLKNSEMKPQGSDDRAIETAGDLLRFQQCQSTTRGVL
ncbi:hypothetical protein Tco_0462805 [Tanacetum coccineum]